MVPRRLALAGLVCLPAAAVWAQSEQYIAPGELGLPRVSTRERVETAVEEARWRFGALRVEPWIGVRDAAWVDNVFGTADDPVSDFTVTAGAGLEAYVPAGKAVLAAYALPEYVWWQDLVDLRQLRGHYGAGLFGYFNRLTVEIDGRLSDSEDFLSAELISRAGIEERRGEAAVAVDVRGPFALFAAASTTAWSYDTEISPGAPGAPPAPVTALDRDQREISGGLRYTLSNGLAIGAGAQLTETEFDDPAGDRSNSGSGPLVEMSFDGNRVDLALRAAYLTLEAEQGSSFQEQKQTSGDFRLGFTPGGRVSGALYGGRTLSYSALDVDGSILDTRLGAALSASLGWRTAADLFVEQGRFEVTTPGGAGDRDDESLSVGGAVRFELRPKLTLLLGATSTDFDSERADLDRKVTTLRAGLSFGGRGGTPW
jgi:hypothetical protein